MRALLQMRCWGHFDASNVGDELVWEASFRIQAIDAKPWVHHTLKAMQSLQKQKSKQGVSAFGRLLWATATTWLYDCVKLWWYNGRTFNLNFLHHKPNCETLQFSSNLEMRDWCSTLQITLMYLHILILNLHSFQTPKNFSSTADLDTICLPHNCLCLNRIIRQTNNYPFEKTSCTWIWLNCTPQHHNCCWQQVFPVFLPTLNQMLGDRQRNEKKLKSEKERKKI